MESKRNGNLNVHNMKKEITESLSVLKEGYIGERELRKLIDGNKFLEMISNSPYNVCKTVSQLKKMISDERNKLKLELMELEKYEPGYQLSLFDTYEQISKRQLEEIQKERERLNEQIHWLHKCLGMCSNMKYFI